MPLICHSGTPVCSMCSSVAVCTLSFTINAGSCCFAYPVPWVQTEHPDNTKMTSLTVLLANPLATLPKVAGLSCPAAATYASPFASHLTGLRVGFPIPQATIPMSSELSCTALLQTSVQFRQTLSSAPCGRPGCSACDVAVSSDLLVSRSTCWSYGAAIYKTCFGC